MSLPRGNDPNYPVYVDSVSGGAAQASEATLAEIKDRIGDDVASPAANTLQDRLKTLAGHLDTVEALLADVDANTDLIEDKLDTAVGHLDGVEGLLTTIRDNADTVEALLADIDANTDLLESLLTDLSKAEDTAHSSGDKGIMVLTVRKDTPTALAGADGEYQPPLTDANGRLHVKPLHSFAADRQGATRRAANHQGQTASFLHYTVAAGTLKCRLILHARNSSTITAGIIHVRDGTTVAGAIVFSMSLPVAVAGQITPHQEITFGSDAFPEHFSTGVFIELNAGTLTVDARMVGVEE